MENRSFARPVAALLLKVTCTVKAFLHYSRKLKALPEKFNHEFWPIKYYEEVYQLKC